MSAPTGERYSRRQVFAFIALAAAPAPCDVGMTDRGTMSISLDSIADLRAWLPVLDADTAPVHTRPHKLDGATFGTLATACVDWRGWVVFLDAFDAVGSPAELDESTQAALTALAGGDPR